MPRKDVAKEIIVFLKKQDWPVTTENVMKGINVSWNTAQVHLLKLVATRRVRYKKVGRQNQFWLSGKYKKEFE
jgi:predicted ArsR family transcriptional regulator